MQCSKHNNFFKDCDDAFPQLLTLSAPQITHYQCFPQTRTLFVVAYICKFILCQQGAIVEIDVSPITAVHKAALRSAHKHCFIRHYMQDDMKMTSNIFWRPLEIQWYKTHAPCFDFETCRRAHVYSAKSRPFGKSICGGQFWCCGGRHK